MAAETDGIKVPEIICNFCQKDQAAVRKMIGFNGGDFICDECVTGFSLDLTEPQNVTCTGCGKKTSEVEGGKMLGGPKTHMCGECIELMVDIIRPEEESPGGESQQPSASG